MSKRLPLAAFLVATALSLLTSLPARAETWPSKPINLIVPYSAGGPTDTIARLLAKKVGASVGQTIIVENKPGAGGTIGVDATLKAAPDGYTFALAGQGPIAGMPNLMKVPYKPTDVQYVTMVARIPSVIVVRADSGITTLAELIKRAKAAPGKLNYASAGPGTSPHIGAELLKQETGIDIVHVPYKGAAPAMTALLAGDVQLAMVDLLPVMQYVNAGKLTIVAVASPTRAPQAPNVPTTKELGFPGIVMDTNYGLIAPAGLPADILKKFRDAVVAVVQSPELKDQFYKQGAIAVTSTPQEYQAFMQAEFDKWHGVVTKGKITLD
jgi:tripartite-type tricarboxylate transporter receptor subunit TctC